MDKNEIFNWWCETKSKHYGKNRPTHAWKVLSNCYKTIYSEMNRDLESVMAEIKREGFEDQLNNEIKKRAEYKEKILLKEKQKEIDKKHEEKYRYWDYNDQFDQI